jgi:uncharacterized protein YhbP (UPF0306 family)
MIPHSNAKTHNIDGLRRSAHQKAERTRHRAEDAIAILLKTQRPINFKTVAETARISTAWLYANEEIKTRIIHLRAQQIPQAQVKIPASEQASNVSKDPMVAALQKRIREQAEKIKELEKQLEVAYGTLYKQEN